MNDIQLPFMFITLIIIVSLWSFIWKGIALWHSARNNDSAWFVVMLFVNTLGILELIYLFGVIKIKADNLFKK